MTAEQATLAGRREVEKLMTTTCTIKRATGDTITDPDTLEEVPVYATIYTGKCKVRQKGNTVKDAAIPGAVLALQTLELSLPVTLSADVMTGDVVTVTANPLDAALVGKQFTIKGQQAQTYATARRYEIEGTN
ncbi:MAG: DUF6093 family protein [Rhodoglobus sp.]